MDKKNVKFALILTAIFLLSGCLRHQTTQNGKEKNFNQNNQERAIKKEIDLGQIKSKSETEKDNDVENKKISNLEKLKEKISSTGNEIDDKVTSNFKTIKGKIIPISGEGEETKEPTTLEKLKGKWVSVRDKRSIWEFNNKTQIFTYNGKKISEEKFQIHSDLESEEKDDNGKYLIIYAGNYTFQYEIIELSDIALSVISLPGGNILNYKRYIADELK